MELSKKELEQIAKLAKLTLNEKENEKFRKQISEILTFVSTLSELDIKDVTLVSQINDEVNNWRNDAVQKESEGTIKALRSESPEKTENLFKIPGVFD